jgi:hypothetical protein
MKPWEQIWEPVEDGVWEPATRTTVAYGPLDTETAKLIAAAPDMARLLLELEWRGGEMVGSGYEFAICCPSCGGEEEPGHRPDCKLLAALRKAGLR